MTAIDSIKQLQLANKTIAIFDGCEIRDDKIVHKVHLLSDEGETTDLLCEPQYHNDWNLIHQVYEKIVALKLELNNEEDIDFFFMKRKLAKAIILSDKEKIFNALYDAICWYNKIKINE